jgi:hypothetical protein
MTKKTGHLLAIFSPNMTKTQITHAQNGSADLLKLHPFASRIPRKMVPI